MADAKKPTTVLGSKEYVDFPDLRLFGVPAKVDTGADSSAIWASNIRERNGKLSFVLFDKTSKFYTGERITTDKYSITSIKNSFGQSEIRYKTALRTMIAGRTVRVNFTLANRSTSRTPILIGGRTLRGKFVVDVAATKPAQQPSRMLLMSAEITPNVRNFKKAVEKASGNDLKITHTSYDDIAFNFTDSGELHITLLSTGEDISTFDIVHFKTTVLRDVTAAMAQYLQRRGVLVVDDAVAHFPDCSKLYQYVILSNNEVPVPASLFVMPINLPNSYDTFVDKLGLPFVLKGIHASRGEHNFIIKDEAAYVKVLELIANDEIFVIGQKFIENDGDYRILVLGRRIALIIHRKSSDTDSHLNNTSKGGTARLLQPTEIPGTVQSDTLTAAKALGRGVAGVDMIQDKSTKMWYCLEVNAGPQIATGAFLEEKQQAFARFIKTELKK